MRAKFLISVAAFAILALNISSCGKSGKSPGSNPLVGLWMTEDQQEDYEIANSSTPERICATANVSRKSVTRASKYNADNTSEDCFVDFKRSFDCYPDNEVYDLRRGPNTAKKCHMGISLRPDGKVDGQLSEGCGYKSTIRLFRVTEEGMRKVIDELLNCRTRK